MLTPRLSTSRLILYTTLTGLSSPAAAQFSSKQFELEIQAGAANETLTQLAEVTKTQLLFPYDLLAEIQTNPIDGRYSFRRALRTMLRGTNLRASYDRSGTVVIYVVDAGGQNIAGTTERPPHTEAAQSEATAKNEAKKGPENRAIPIEEIFVTSRKRSESIRDVPFSIAAQTEATIFLSGASNLYDLAQNITGLTFVDLGPGQSQMAIRGVSSGQVVRDQPGIKEQVGVYLDETAISMALFTPDLDFFDMKRVEVLRGPQGTLFGSGSLAGTVRYISNAPDLAHHSFQAETTVAATQGGSATSTLKAAANIPFKGNRAAIRAVGYYHETPGYVDARGPEGAYKKNVNAGDKYGGRLALTVALSERLTVTPRLVFQHQKTGGFPRTDLFNVLANPYTQSRPPVSLGITDQYIQLEESFEEDFLMADMVLKYEWDDTSLISVSSLIDRDIAVTRDSGALTVSTLAQPSGFGLSGPILEEDAPLHDKTALQVFSQELRLSSDSGEALEYVLGGFFTTSDRTYGQTLAVPGFEAETGIVTSADPALADHLFFSRFTYDFHQLALFGEATYRLSEKLSLSAGARWFNFSEERTLRLDGLFAATGSSFSPQTSKTESSGLTPRFLLSYAVSAEFQLNAQIAKGFRLGGINDPLNTPLCSADDLETFGNRPFFDNEELWNYEIGLKSTLAGGRLTFDAAVFYADIQNLQATVDAGSCSSRVIFNVPKARSLGIETEIFIRPHPDFDISLSATMQNAEIRSTLVPEGGGGALGGIIRGNRLPTSPTFQASAQTSYHWIWNESWNGFASLTLSYVGASYSQIHDQVDGFGTIDLSVTDLGDPSIQSLSFNPQVPSYFSGNIRIGARYEALELSLYIHNLWNETIYTSIDRERGGLARFGYTVGRPRTLGLTLRTSF